MKLYVLSLLLSAVFAYTEIKKDSLVQDNMEPAENGMLAQDFYQAVALAEFTGPSIVGEFNFVQDSSGETVATGAFQKGLKPGQHYLFKFYSGSSCRKLGKVLIEHDFDHLQGLSTGGTVPIKEKLDQVHLTGTEGLIGLPWVLSDGSRDLACVVLKASSV